MMLGGTMGLMQSVAAVPYATLSSTDKAASITLSNGNLTATCTSDTSKARSTIGKSSGKWYWELSINGLAAPLVGIAKSASLLTAWPGQDLNSWAYYHSNGQKYTNAVAALYGASYGAGDVIGVALDMNTGTLSFYKNNVSQGVAYSGLSGTMYACVGNSGLSTPVITVNFGATPFTYAPPAGFNAGLYT